MSYTPALDQLIQSLRCLPGVGPKSAQRMAFYLLQHDRGGAASLANALEQALNNVGYCDRCRMFSEDDLCEYCSNPGRDNGQLCVVESPSDVLAIEHGASYGGQYFLLMGNLSPLDGIGPDELGMDLLARRLDEGKISELIVATSSTVEGEATAHYLAEMAATYDVKVSRLAQGVPMGGELEYIDGSTLAQAFNNRKTL